MPPVLVNPSRFGPAATTAPTYQSIAGNTVAVGVSSNTTPKPTATTVGDLLVAFCSDGAGTSNGFTAPAGWTAGAVTGASGNGAIFYKLAGGSEPADYTFTRPASSGVFVVSIVRISGANQTAPVADTSVLGTGSGGSSSAALTGVTATAANTLLFQMLNISATGTTVTAPGGTTKVYDTNTAGTLRQVAGGTETVSAGATSTRTWTISGAPQWRGAMIAVNPA